MNKIALGVSLILTLLLLGCQDKMHNTSDEHENASGHSVNEHHEAGKLLTTTPIKMDTVITKEYVCQIHSRKHIELRALEKGYIQNIFVDEGQLVKKGEMMFKIMPRLYEAEVRKSEAERNKAEIEFQNTQSLAEKNIVSPNELALAKAELEKSEAEVALAQTHLDFTDVRAPFEGLMNHLHVREGSMVDEGELLTTLSDNSQMWVYFNVPEAEYLNYMKSAQDSKGRTVKLQMANKDLYDFTGKITAIEADFDSQTGNIPFRATFPNPKRLLRHGETGNILMETRLEKVLIIPQKATFDVLDKKFVYVVDENDEIHSREIEISTELPHLFVVSKGLAEEDKILLEGLRKVKNGDKITHDNIPPAKVLANLDLYAE
jgi:membrane fusion protein (multidrug efflux system)